MSWKTECLKTINITPHVATYCGLLEGHAGECEPSLEEWQLELAVKLLEKRGYKVICPRN